MENFQSHLPNVPYNEYCERTPATTEEKRQLAGGSAVLESRVLVSDKSHTFSSLPVYQPGGLYYSSSCPVVFPHGSSTKYSEKNFGHSSNTYRSVGVDMTNRNVSVNSNVTHPDSIFVSPYLPKTKLISNGIHTGSSESITSSRQVVSSSDRCLENTSMEGNRRRNQGITMNMSVTESTMEAKNNTVSASVHNVEENCVNCVEKTSIGCVFSCGGCEQSFYTICRLHAHIKTHNQDGSYYYMESTKTAYPKFDSCMKSTQTEVDGKGHKHSEQEDEIVEDSLRKVYIEENICLNKTDEVCNVNFKNGLNEALVNEVEPEIKVEKEDSEDIPDLSNMNRSGSDTDDYKPEDSIHESQKKRQKYHSKKDNKKNRVKLKGSKKLKKLKMTIKLKQEERKEKRASFLKKDRKSKPNSKRNARVKKLDEKINCKLCDTDFSKRLYLRHHIKAKHSDVEHLCQLCSEHFSTDSELIEHRKTIHNRGYHRCELCDKVLSTKGMLEGHYLVHKGIKPFACDICVPKKEFTRKCQLKAHMDTHSAEKTLQCEFCGKPFNARYLMLSHVKHCGGIKPHKCDYCEMSFVSNHCLQRHRRIHTGEKPFVCEVCAFASSNASCLARHLRTHTGEKPFTCQYCPQTFAARGALKKHVRIHTQEKPYKCRFCTKAFTQNWNLKTHERQHTGETPYKCHVCGVGYKQNVLLKTHLRTHFGPNSNGSESQTLALSPPVSHSQIEDQASAHNQSVVNLQSGSKPDNLKLEFSQSQAMSNQQQQIELHTQPLVPNILLSSFLHSGYNMN